ncbi:ribosome biogenesis GTPase YlqF [Clostridium cylindrosporum]|uniref:Ribosome biogenesis GTPase A n=1 Tax=Clostridium cylindrosporum DSM 605 TaxID=1121307 RepID=A0A0J8D5T6_CLOCY|nr:ribosome biogenesis GTPase YlqF [Clostridium cylindrosporum]KMT21490.1 ribosome biogenesis GTPase A [Clostridium cylindrosporum DSM 605]
MNIQWYPGHMAKTKREIKENLKLVDVVIELLDARIPLSSRNPDLDEIIAGKEKVVLLNKADLANDAITRQWIEYYKEIGIEAMAIDSISGKGLNKIYAICKEAAREKIERIEKKGIIGRPLRAMVTGIPNVGKSSFINKIGGKSTARTGDKPGVTRSKQWIKVNKDFELQDTPGVLWPKFDDNKVAQRLAFTRAIKDEILDIEELAYFFVKYIQETNPSILKDRYNVDLDMEDPYETMINIGRKRGCVVSGGGVDTIRVSNLILDEFRTGKLGRISLETPEVINDLGE